MKTLEVGSLRAEPGTKATGFLDVPGTPIRCRSRWCAAPSRDRC